jgi:hypothetical protein
VLHAEAAQYFVSRNGNDSAAGTSAQAPFQTPERAFRALQAGDSVYLRSGDYWRLNEPLFVYVSGTSAMPVVVGAYQQDAGGRVTFTASERPILDGAAAVPRIGEYVGLINVRGNHVHVQDVELRNSGGHGVAFTDSAFGVVENVKTDWTYHSGITMQNSTDMTVAASEVVGDSHNYFDLSFWAGGIAVVGGARVTVEDCLVRNGYGEAISAFLGAHDIVFRGNTVFGARAVALYVNAAYNVEIRDNLVLGTSDTQFHRHTGAGFVGPGIAVNNEAYQYSGGSALGSNIYARNVRIVNNLVAATQTGVALWTEIDVPIQGVEILHNTFVDNRYQIETSQARYESVSVANNIFVSLSSNTNVAALSPVNVSWRSNYWSSTPPSSARNSGDVYGNLSIRKMSGWQALRLPTEATWADFAPVSDAPTIGAGRLNPVADRDYNGVTRSDPTDLGALTGRNAGSSRPSRPVIVSLVQ